MAGPRATGFSKALAANMQTTTAQPDGVGQPEAFVARFARRPGARLALPSGKTMKAKKYFGRKGEPKPVAAAPYPYPYPYPIAG